MKIKPMFYGIKKDHETGHKIQFHDRVALQKYLSSFKEDTELQVIIEKRSKRRSNQQNRYYWGVVIDILGDYFGYTPEEMHEALKWQFLCKDRAAKLPTVKSTAALKTTEFEDYMSAIRSWASIEYGVYIPNPDEESIQSIFS